MLDAILHAAATNGDVSQLERVLSQSRARGGAASVVGLLQAAMKLAICSGSTSMALRLLEAEREAVASLEVRADFDMWVLSEELALADTEKHRASRALMCPSRINVPPQHYECHTCRRVGHHFHRQCPLHVCERCGGKGHLAKTCPTVDFVPRAGYVCTNCGVEGDHYSHICPLVRGAEPQSKAVLLLRPILTVAFNDFPAEWAAAQHTIGASVDEALCRFNTKYLLHGMPLGKSDPAKSAMLDKVRTASGAAVIDALAVVQDSEAMGRCACAPCPPPHVHPHMSTPMSTSMSTSTSIVQTVQGGKGGRRGCHPLREHQKTAPDHSERI